MYDSAAEETFCFNCGKNLIIPIVGKYALYALVLYVRRLQNLRKELENNYALHGDCVDIITADDDSENKNIREWLQILETIDPMRAGRYKYLGKEESSRTFQP
jgi:hypothetical protein